MIFGNGKHNEVIKLAKGIVVGVSEPVDVAYVVAYRYVYGKYTDKMPPSAENEIWRCQDYQKVSMDEYRRIKAVYESNRV